MGFLALKVLCSVGVGLTVRHAAHKGINRLGMIRINYAAAAIIAFLLLVVRPEVRVSRTTLWIALVAGVSYAATMLLWSQAISRSGIAKTVGFTRMSVIIPVMVSMLVWKEIPRLTQSLGIVLGVAALLITSHRPTRDCPQEFPAGNSGAVPSPGTAWDSPGFRGTKPWGSPCAQGETRPAGPLLLAGLFVASGVAALSAKLFQELCPAQENLHFQALLFVIAFMVATVSSGTVPLFRSGKGDSPQHRERTDRKSLEWGLVLGTVNVGSSIFMVLALGLIAGPLAFPISAAAEVAVLAVLGRVVWKEPLDRLSMVGLGMTLAALVLVQLR
jgi:drug/metabolite transporter (DMT)-like permease